MATAVLSPQPHSNSHTLPGHTLPSYIQANQGQVPQPQLGWLKPTPLSTPIAEMRRRLESDEYLFIKGLIPRADVLAMREHYFSQYTDTSLLEPGRPAVDGIFKSTETAESHRGIGGGATVGDELIHLAAAHTTPEYLAFLAHPALRQMVRDLTGWSAEVLLQRTMLRHHVPHGTGTGVHYDKIFLRDGSAMFLTAWVPLGDISVRGGGLIYLEHSAALGQAIEDDFSRRADAADMTAEQRTSAFNAHMSAIGVLTDNPGEFEAAYAHIADAVGEKDRQWKWLVANYEAGDVVFHLPCAVHASATNEDPDRRIRLSTDLRFYDQADYDEGRADTRWMKVWSIGDGL